jgi:L-rhamnose isomerase/sugar isomerase
MKLGSNALALINLEQQFSNSNLGQLILMLNEGKLGGIHFNGKINPYQLFLIFNELVQRQGDNAMSIRWIIHPTHNSRDPLEDILQCTEAILVAYAQALIVEKDQLIRAREANDAVKEEEILQSAFRTDVRPLLSESRLSKGGTLNPIEYFRANNLRNKLIEERRHKFSGSKS